MWIAKISKKESNRFIVLTDNNNFPIGIFCRNLLSIGSQLNQIDPSTNIIFLPNVEQGYRTKFEILPEGVFKYSIE